MSVWNLISLRFMKAQAYTVSVVVTAYIVVVTTVIHVEGGFSELARVRIEGIIISHFILLTAGRDVVVG